MVSFKVLVRLKGAKELHSHRFQGGKRRLDLISWCLSTWLLGLPYMVWWLSFHKACYNRPKCSYSSLKTETPVLHSITSGTFCVANPDSMHQKMHKSLNARSEDHWRPSLRVATSVIVLVVRVKQCTNKNSRTFRRQKSSSWLNEIKRLKGKLKDEYQSLNMLISRF